jgi:hypothetical protein
MMLSFFFPMGANQSLRGKGLLLRSCAIRVPPDLCASGTLTRSTPAHSVGSREKPSKRRKEAWEESRAEAGVEAEPPFEAVFEAIEAAEAEAIEAGVENPRPRAEGAAEAPVVEAAVVETAVVEAAVHAGVHAAVRALGVKLAWSPQHHQEG